MVRIFIFNFFVKMPGKEWSRLYMNHNFWSALMVSCYYQVLSQFVWFEGSLQSDPRWRKWLDNKVTPMWNFVIFMDSLDCALLSWSFMIFFHDLQLMMMHKRWCRWVGDLAVIPQWYGAPHLLMDSWCLSWTDAYKHALHSTGSWIQKKKKLQLAFLFS